MDVVWLLDGDTLALLRRTLQPPTTTSGPHNRKRISLERFVAEVYRAICLRQSTDHGSIGRNQAETRHLVKRMCILFDLVDVDSVGNVDWEHFTDFCVYMRGRDSGSQGLEEDGEPGASKGGGEVEEGGMTRFIEKLGYTDRSSHCHEIRIMRFAKGLELLVVVEGTAILKIYSPGPHKLGQIEPAITVRKLMIDNKRSARIAAPKANSRGSGGDAATRADSAVATGKGTEESMAVLAMDFIGRDNQAAVSCADGYLTIWDLESFKLLRYTRLRDVQVGLRFCPSMDVLTSWGVDEFNHEIIVWDVDKLEVLRVLDGHCEPVKDTYEVAPSSPAGKFELAEKLWEPILVTTGMDHKVVLWDLRLGAGEGNLAPKKLFVMVGHYHGVLSLAYSSEHDLILSAGFDFDANCWDRSTSHLDMKLVGHRLSLIGVVVVEHETQRAVTGDEGGSFRVWDIQRGHSDHGTCLQAFSLRNTRVSPRSMAVVWKEGLVVAGSKMHVFRAVPSVTAEVSPLGAWFSSYTGELCIVLREAVLFDAATGSVKRRAFQQTHGREITAFCTDARHKKAVVGDQRGDLRMYDGVTGKWVMSAAPHRSEVSALLFIDEDNAFISAGWDGMIQVHDARVRSFSATRPQPNMRQAEGEQAPIGHSCAFTLRSIVNAHDGDITLMAASARFGLVATASSDLTVRLWDYGLLRLEEVIVAHRQEITCVRFLDPLPSLATADMTGKVFIWATRPHPNGGALLLVIRNTAITAGEDTPKATGEASERRARMQRRVLPTPVTCIAFRHHKPAYSDPAEAVAAQRARRLQVAAERKKSSTAVSNRQNDEGLTQQPPPLPGQGKASTTAGPDMAATPRPWEIGSALFTGDELGSVKVWDLTDILLDKLGPAACGVKAAEDKATNSPSSFGSASHHFIHYRQGPLDGVGLQAAIRFRELIDIARVLRRGEHLQAEKPESESDTWRRRAGLDRGGSVPGGGNKTTRPASLGKSSVGDSVSASSTAGRSRDPSSVERRRQGLGLDRKKPRGRAKGASTPLSPGTAASDACGSSQQRARRPVGTKEQAEATLNARPDDIDPVFSWTGHEDSITSMQIISSPPCILTGSLDNSARLFSLGGLLLGVMAERKNGAGMARPWLFEPPPNGRDAEASVRAAALEQRLKTVRHQERQSVPAPRNSELPTNLWAEDRSSTPSSPPCKAPANGSEFGAAPTDFKSGSAGLRREDGSERIPIPAGSSVDEAWGDKGGGTTLARRCSSRTQSAISAMCLSRIKELAQVRVETAAANSDVRSDSLRTAEENIEERLLSEAREGRNHQRRGGSTSQSPPSPVETKGERHKRHGHHHTSRPSNRDSEPPSLLVQKVPPNLSAEQERKHAKRTRSALHFLSDSVTRTNGAGADSTFSSPRAFQPQDSEAVEGPRVVGRAARVGGRPFTSPGLRAKSPMKRGEVLTRDDSVTALSRSKGTSPASKIRRGVLMMAPYLALRMEETSNQSTPPLERGGAGAVAGRGGGGPLAEQGGGRNRNSEQTETHGIISPTQERRLTANLLQTHRSVMTVASAKSLVSKRSNFSIRPAISTKAAVARRFAADRRHRRMDDILDGVRRIGRRDGRPHPLPPGAHVDGDDNGDPDPTFGEEEEEEAKASWGTARVKDRGAVAVVISTRVQEVLSRFERSVNGDGDDQDSGSGDQVDHKVKSMRRQLEARTAARQEAIRHNERYRRAQRYDLVTLQETQQRRQEAMVGLTGPSGERFGPYSLDDVLEFQVFANHLNARGAEHLTVRGLVENPDIRADPYSHALLQELGRSRVLQWNQPLSLEDLMQLVFHFAKHDEAKRMLAVMDIAMLLERLRDAFLVGKSSLVGKNGSLPFHFINDIDTTFRATGGEACGTCTMKELHGVMARVGSELFSLGQEDLDRLAAQCGVVDGHKELTAGDLTAIIAKLVSLQQGH